jgi:hypothetical protein
MFLPLEMYGSANANENVWDLGQLWRNTRRLLRPTVPGWAYFLGARGGEKRGAVNSVSPDACIPSPREGRGEGILSHLRHMQRGHAAGPRHGVFEGGGELEDGVFGGGFGCQLDADGEA